MTSYYYHAGARLGADGSVVWSRHTRRSKDAAEREARRMAGKGGDPIVEYWRREHGLRPGDCELVAGAYDVAGDEPGKE